MRMVMELVRMVVQLSQAVQAQPPLTAHLDQRSARRTRHESAGHNTALLFADDAAAMRPLNVSAPLATVALIVETKIVGSTQTPHQPDPAGVPGARRICPQTARLVIATRIVVVRTAKCTALPQPGHAEGIGGHQTTTCKLTYVQSLPNSQATWFPVCRNVFRMV